MNNLYLPTHAYGGFWRRVLAALVDALLFAIVEAPFLLLAYGPEYYDWDAPAELVAGWVDLVVSWIMPAVVTILFWRWKRATPAKMLLKMQIVDADTGETPTVGQCILRYVGYVLAALPCGLGLLWVAWDERKQGWHDRIANTVVVRSDAIANAIAVATPNTGPPAAT